jgi:integral membrane sensor domain MASE1
MWLLYFFSYMTSLAVIKLRTLLLLVTMNARSCHLNASFVCWLLSTGFVILLPFLLNFAIDMKLLIHSFSVRVVHQNVLKAAYVVIAILFFHVPW